MSGHHSEFPLYDLAESPVEYRDIPGYPGYRVGDDGTVWSCLRQGGRGPRKMTDRWVRLKPWTNRGRAYLHVELQLKDGKRSFVGVHILVLLAFVGPRPDGLECRHLDGDPANNHPSNLRWGTSKDNADDRRRHGTQTRGSAHGPAKLTGEKVAEVKRLLHGGVSQRGVAKAMGVGKSAIDRIATGVTWKHVKG